MVIWCFLNRCKLILYNVLSISTNQMIDSPQSISGSISLRYDVCMHVFIEGTYLVPFGSTRRYNVCSEFLSLSAVVMGLVRPCAAADASPIVLIMSDSLFWVSLYNKIKTTILIRPQLYVYHNENILLLLYQSLSLRSLDNSLNI